MRLDQDAPLRDGDQLLVFPPVTGGEGDLRWVGKSVTKRDALGKATGQAKFYSDLRLKNMLYGRVLRANRPHALIKRVDVSRAQALPGVVAVLTHKDVQGTNRYGIVTPDQPFCVRTRSATKATRLHLLRQRILRQLTARSASSKSIMKRSRWLRTPLRR